MSQNRTNQGLLLGPFCRLTGTSLEPLANFQTVSEGVFSEVRLVGGDSALRLRTCPVGTRSLASARDEKGVEQNAPTRLTGGKSYGRRQAPTEASRLRRRRPRHGAERPKDARLDHLHHRRPAGQGDGPES